MRSAFQIIPYNVFPFAAYISDFTSTPISVVMAKRQVSYINGYLSHWEQEKTMMIEEEYIDSSFLEDFSSYFVRCFQHHKRNCSRIHFFLSNQKDLESLEKFTDNEDAMRSLQDAYLGFVVIRPIPDTFIAKVCLKKWEKLNFVISHKESASFLGEQFLVDTVPFQEQDRVLSVCATTALWSFFYANGFVKRMKKDSPYQITKKATESDYRYQMNQNLTGLSLEMMGKSISNAGLKPFHFSNNDDVDSCYFYSVLSSFLSSGIPVVLGLTVYSGLPKKRGSKEKGYHAVVALGGKSLKEESDFYDEMYVHDDRVGPYARLVYDHKQKCWTMEIDNSVSNKCHESEYYIITDAICGLPNMVQLPYKTVLNFSESLFSEIKNLDENIGLKIHYDIKLEKGSLIKSRIKKNLSVINKSDILYAALPKYCWLVQVLAGKDELFEFIIDSSSIPQDDFILEIAYYNENSKLLCEDIKKLINKHVKQDGGVKITDLFFSAMLPYYNFFNHKPDNYEYLASRYGDLHSPPYFHDEELKNNEIKYQNPSVIRDKNDIINFKLDKNKKYIWAIDKNGYLLLGTEDKSNPDSDNQGHTTLLMGRKARIAGELFYKDSCWKINSKSGRYSNIYTDDQKKLFLKNVKEDKFESFFEEYEVSIEAKEDAKS